MNNEDTRESRIWFREDRSAGAIRRSLDAAEILTEFKRRLEERRTPELKGMMGCRSTRNSFTENLPWSPAPREESGAVLHCDWQNVAPQWPSISFRTSPLP